MIVPSGYSYASVLLLLGGIYVLVKDRGFLPIDGYDKLILGTLMFFGLEGMFNWLWHGFDGDFDKASRFVLALPVFYVVYRARPSLHALWLGIAFGVIGALVLAVYQSVYLGVPRVYGHSHAIQFGNLAMLLGVFCLAGLGWAASLTKHRRKYVILLSLAAVAGVVTSALSGSRGGWLGLPIILLVVFFAYYSIFSLRAKFFALLFILVGGFYLVNSPQIGVKDRIQRAYQEIGLFQDGKVNTSVGLRLVMWRGAFKLAQEKPLFGWGQEGYKQGMQQLREEDKIRGNANAFNHAHNEFIDRLVKQGLMGFVALLLLYQVPLWTFASAKRDDHLPTRAVAMAGVLLSLCYFDFGLTQSFLRHNNGVMVFVAFMTVIAGYFKVLRLSRTQIKFD
ncbi:MAG: O-antigen ligase [Alcaligenaceae bacterium]|nr:O-antigen ligase [Alcaligenaceae bacterium]